MGGRLPDCQPSDHAHRYAIDRKVEWFAKMMKLALEELAGVRTATDIEVPRTLTTRPRAHASACTPRFPPARGSFGEIASKLHSHCPIPYSAGMTPYAAASNAR